MAFSRVLRYAKLSETEEIDFKILFIQSLLSGFGASFFFVVVNTFFLKKTSKNKIGLYIPLRTDRKR